MKSIAYLSEYLRASSLLISILRLTTNPSVTFVGSIGTVSPNRNVVSCKFYSISVRPSRAPLLHWTVALPRDASYCGHADPAPTLLLFPWLNCSQSCVSRLYMISILQEFLFLTLAFDLISEVFFFQKGCCSYV